MSRIRDVIPIGSLILGIVAAVLLYKADPAVPSIGYPANLVGIAFVALGILLVARSIAIFVKRKTDIRPGGSPTTLITDGPYRYTRNPIYTGNMLILFGVCLLIGTLLPFVVIPAYFVVVSTLVIPFEEQKLTATFGGAYTEYQAKVGRWM